MILEIEVQIELPFFKGDTEIKRENDKAVETFMLTTRNCYTLKFLLAIY